jgi:hypothetical protein
VAFHYFRPLERRSRKTWAAGIDCTSPAS